MNRMKTFSRLCLQISSEPQLTVKTQIMQGFVQEYTGCKALLYRLVLPVLSQRKYYVGDKQLVVVFSRISGKSEQFVRDFFSKDCDNDISEVAKKLKIAGKTKKTSTLTLVEVDDFLNKMTKVTTDEKRVAEMSLFLKECSGEELKWIIRMMKNDMKLGAGRKSLLDALHPEAYETYKTASHLTTLVQMLFGEDEVVTGGDITAPGSPKKGGLIQHHIPVQPQLARAAKSLDDVVARCPNGFFSEIKYDGERIQIHKTNGEFTFWSRSLKPMKADKYAGMVLFQNGT